MDSRWHTGSHGGTRPHDHDAVRTSHSDRTVFTPEEWRAHGYGSGVTAALCEELVSRGSRVIFYVDADYPSSNRVYQRLGFREIDELIEYDEHRES